MIQRLKNVYHLFQAFIACIWYGFPSKKLKVIGVTGTDGKTTTTHAIFHILTASGKKVSMISTVYAKIGASVYDTGLHTTTPNPFMVQKLLASAVDHRDEYFVLETTSHALDQNRVWGVDYQIGVLTNITHEHLDYHSTYEKYVQSKNILLKRSHISILNKDDQSYGKLKINGRKVKTYGLKKGADYQEDFRKDFPNLAEFNAYNYLAAYSVCRELGIEKDSIVSAMKDFQLPPGRIDVLYDKQFKVIVDFAHTPNAIGRLLKSMRTQYLQKEGNLIHVFGSAGLRDNSKRYLMGDESARYADMVILTEEDYRTEDPLVICSQIEAGLLENGFKKTPEPSYTKKTLSVVIDRETAIKKAISLARPHDLVIITGKGHEKSLCRGTKEYSWNDEEAVNRIFSYDNLQQTK